MLQNITINGTLFVATIDTNGGVSRIETPNIRDPSNGSQPFAITYDPAGTLANVYYLYYLLSQLGLLPPA